MTLDEIQQMSGEELDARLAHGFFHPSSVLYHSSFGACHAAEERLKEMGLACRFAERLEHIVLGEGVDDFRSVTMYRIAHASPRERAEAILWAMQKGEKP